MNRRPVLSALLALVLLLSACMPVARQPGATPPLPEGGLTVWFIDVGQADCVLVTDGEASLLVDAGNNADGDLVVGFLREQGVDSLDFAIGTHPHEDHIGGLDAVLDAIDTGALILPSKESDTATYLDLLDAADRAGVRRIAARAGDAYEIGGFTMTLLGPVTEYDDMNNNSVVARIDYGETSFLLTGDIEERAEKDIVSMGYDLECTVLKAAHHGSETSSSYIFLRAAYPQMAVVQCGEGNSYGHPHDGPMSRFRDVGATVYRTDTMGTIRMVSDGETVAADPRGVESDVPRARPGEDGLADGSAISGQRYIGNKNSKKFHLPDCSNLPAEQNQIPFDSRAEAVAAGYDPCGTCKP